MSLWADVRSLFTFRDSPARLGIAIQAALAIGIPTIGFALAGRADLGLLTSTGTFTALYLSGRSRHERATLLPLIALGLVVSSTIGALTAALPVISLIALFFVASAACVLTLGFSVGPPGALFFVLVCGVSGHLVAPVAAGGAALPAPLVVGLLALGCAIAYLVVLTPLINPSHRTRDASIHRERQKVTFTLDGVSRIILTRQILALAIATALSAPLGTPRAYWVVMTVVAVLQNGHRIRMSVLRGAHRVLGTLVGVAVFALVVTLNPTGIWVAILVTVLQFLIELVVIRNYGLALVLITPLALTIAAQAHSGPAVDIIRDRVADTVLGAVVAIGVLFLAHGWDSVSKRRVA
ncbi:MAG TPA: FUSC family protein [Glaciihabitans sp.]|nr:FUSC family protein [Glaciihabitans sp.]